MLSLEMTVQYLDGRTVQVRTNVRDEVAFERHFQVPISSIVPKSALAKALASNGSVTANELAPEDLAIRMEWVYFMAWHPLYRTGQETAEFDPFLDLIDGITMGFAPSGPTVPVPSTVP